VVETNPITGQGGHLETGVVFVGGSSVVVKHGLGVPFRGWMLLRPRSAGGGHMPVAVEVDNADPITQRALKERLDAVQVTLAPADSTVSSALSDYARAVLRGETGDGGELAPSTQAEDAFVVVENAAVSVIEQPGSDTFRSGEVLDSLKDLKLARLERVGELSNTIALPLILLLLVMAALNLAGIGLFPSGTSRALKRMFGFVVAVAVASMLTAVVLLESVQFIHPGLSLPLEGLIADVNGR